MSIQPTTVYKILYKLKSHECSHNITSDPDNKCEF